MAAPLGTVAAVNVVVRYRPLPNGWIDPVTVNRKPTPFKASWDSTVDLLRREVDMLGASEVVVQLDVPDDMTMWRIDGGLRAAYVTNGPGVVVSLDSRHGPLRYACDRFRLPRDGRESWQCNVRAVALALESLRQVERYGIGRGTEQYTGFAQLGTGTPLGAALSAPMTRKEAIDFLAEWSGYPAFDIAAYPDTARRAWRDASKRLHPDAAESTPELFVRLNDARTTLEF